MLENLLFNRQFSLTLYKNKKLPLGEMSFFKDFVHDRRGNMYPLLDSDGAVSECVSDGRYRVSAPNGRAVRLVGRFFPYASYEICLESLEGTVGFRFIKRDATFDILFTGRDGDLFFDGQTVTPLVSGLRLIFSCRGKYTDLYTQAPDAAPRLVTTVCADSFADICREDVFSDAKAALYVAGDATLRSVTSYMDCGLSQADLRPIRYENGEVMVENGKVFFSMSVRMEAGGYQGIFSHVPGTADFELCGALFYDAGDGVWANDVALSMLYHRTEHKWMYWVCSFSHGHILAHGTCDGEIRYGVNVLDVTLLPRMTANDPDTAFLGKEGDEDPDFVYEEQTNTWFLSVCRLVEDASGRNYRYFLFRSDKPFEGYTHVSHATSGAETGGSFVRDEKGLAFVCGSGFDRVAEYRIHRVPDFEAYSLLKHDHNDGGFRGWGTVFPIRCGSRTRWYHFTFDRHNASAYNWSYGNLYCFLGKPIQE